MIPATPFQAGLKQYLSMALHLWPALQLSFQHLESATQPPQQSPIPYHNYKSMQSEEFIEVITDDMVGYIMQHDVGQDHIIDYLDDILAIFNTEQEKGQIVKHMAKQLCLLIDELQNGDNSRLINFRFVYQGYKGVKVQCEVRGDQSASQNDDEDDDEEYDEEYDEEEDEQKNDAKMEQYAKGDEAPELTPAQKQNLEDEGWVVVAKKKGKK